MRVNLNAIDNEVSLDAVEADEFAQSLWLWRLPVLQTEMKDCSPS